MAPVRAPNSAVRRGERYEPQAQANVIAPPPNAATAQRTISTGFSIITLSLSCMKIVIGTAADTLKRETLRNRDPESRVCSSDPPNSSRKGSRYLKFKRRAKPIANRYVIHCTKFQENMPLVKIAPEKIRPAVTPIVATKEVSKRSLNAGIFVVSFRDETSSISVELSP